MKNLLLPTVLLVAVATVATFKYGNRVAPEIQGKSRTVATAKTPAEVTGVREIGDRYLLVGKDGPITVSRGTSLWVALDRVRREDLRDLPQDPFAVGLVDDPANPDRSLVVAWKPAVPPIAQP